MKVFLISLSLLLLALVGARAHAAESKFEILSQLQEWKSQVQAREDLEDREKDLRIGFINRLSFQVESKYKEASWNEFFKQALEDMRDTDQRAQNLSFASNQVFLENLQNSLTSLIERNEDPLDFIRAFTEFSGLTDPASVDEFAETRSYYNGQRIAAAKPLSIDEAAQWLEQKEIEAAKPLQDPLWNSYHTDLRETYGPKENEFLWVQPITQPPSNLMDSLQNPES